MKISISTRSFGAIDPKPIELLRSRGFDLVFNSYGRKLNVEETVELLNGAVGLIAGTERLDDLVFSAAPDLRIISRVGVGLDNVDMAAAGRRGITTFNTPNAPSLAVAELTIASMLALMRHTHICDNAVRRGEWTVPIGRQLTGATIGIIGLGRIGREVARMLAPFRPRLLAYDPVRSADAQILGVQYTELDGLLASSDIVTLHLALTETSRGLLNAARLAHMKSGALLLNMARGELIEEDALFQVLSSGRLAGAALDAFSEEPYRGPLISLPQVILTPHIASNTWEARHQMEIEAVENLLRGLQALDLPSAQRVGR